MDNGRVLNSRPEKQLVDQLSSPEYRRAFVEGHATDTVAFQLRAMRKARGWEQKDVAERLGSRKLQPMISRYENPDYGKYSISTLLELAAAFDVALAVRFVPFSELVEWDLSPTRSKDCPVPFLEDHRLKEIAKDGLLQQSAASPNGLSTARPRLNSVASERCEQIEPVRFAGSPSAQNQPTLSALGHLSPTAKGSASAA